MNNSIHLIILSVAVLVGGYYFYREINKMKDKFSNLERLHLSKDEEKDKSKSPPTFYANTTTNNAMLETEFANFTYDENENTDSENNNIDENIVNEQMDDILEQTPSDINLNENAYHNNNHEPDSFVSSIINDTETENRMDLDLVSKENNEIFNTEPEAGNEPETDNEQEAGNEQETGNGHENVNFVEENTVGLETSISTENGILDDTVNQILPDDYSDENSSEEKMEIIESYLNNQSGNISLTNKEELLKHYTSFKLNDIKSEFVKLGLKVPKGKKKELIDELISNMSSSSPQ